MGQEVKQIDLYENKDQMMNMAIDKIVVEIFNRRKKNSLAQTIAFTGCSPLCGVTSTCISIAIATANTQRKTLLIDCDVRKSIQYKKLNEKTTIGLANFLLKEDNLEMKDIVYQTNIENLSYIPCGIYGESPTRILCSPKMEELLASVREMYDCVILDFPSINIVPDVQIFFDKVDGIVLVSALGETKKAYIKDAKLRVKNYMEHYYGMIVNKIPHDQFRKLSNDYDYYFFGKKGEQKLSKKMSGKSLRKMKIARNMTEGMQDDRRSKRGDNIEKK